MWLTVINFPAPYWKELLNWIQKWGVWWQVECNKSITVGEPVPDQSSPMETDIIPEDNKLGLLWPVLDFCVMKCVQKANNEGCVVGTEDGVVMQDWMEIFDSCKVPLKLNSI